MSAIEHHRDKRNSASAKRVDGQQGMIDPAKPGPSDNDRWKLEAHDQVHHIGFGRDGHPDATDAFDNDVVIPAAEQAVDLPDDPGIDGPPFRMRRRERGDGKFKLIGTDGAECFLASDHCAQHGRIRSSDSGGADSCFDGLHHAHGMSAALQSHGQRRGDQGFPDTRISAGDTHASASS